MDVQTPRWRQERCAPTEAQRQDDSSASVQRDSQGRAYVIITVEMHKGGVFWVKRNTDADKGNGPSQ